MGKIIRGMMLGAAIALASAGGAWAQVFEGFQAMAFPRADLPIGAKWFPNVGPSGGGADPANVVTRQGLASAVLNETTKASIVASLAGYLGVDGNVLTTRNASFSNLAVTSVVDFTRLDALSAGEQVLAQAIRAGAVSIQTDSGGAARLKASAEARGLPVEVTVTGDNSRHVKLDGSNLYVAYQVVEFTGGQRRVRRANHDGQSVTVDGVWQIDFQHAGGESIADGAARVEVTNLAQPSLTGAFNATVIDYRATRDWTRQFPLPPVKRGDAITAASIQIQYRPTCTAYPLCVVEFPRSQNRVTVTTSTFTVRPVRAPKGL